MILNFSKTGFSLSTVAAEIIDLINNSTSLTYQQKSDCVEGIQSIALDEFEPGVLNVSNQFSFTGFNGYTSNITYSSNRNINFHTIDAFISLQIDTEVVSVADPVPTSNEVSATAPTFDPWTPTIPGALPAAGANGYNFQRVTGQSVILPDITANIDTKNTGVYLDSHSLNGIVDVTDTGSNYVRAVVKANSVYIPNYTKAELYVNGVMATSGYSTDSGYMSEINLFTTLSNAGLNTVNFLITTTGPDAWVASTSLECSGGARFINGSCRGFAVGNDAVSAYPTKYDVAMAAEGCLPGTYIEKASFNNALYYPYKVLDNSDYFHCVFSSGSTVLSSGAIYGILLPTTNFVGTAGTYTPSVFDTFIQFTVTNALTTTNIPFKLYSPYTYTLTGKPVWVQTVLPDSNDCTSLTVNWGDGITDNLTNTVSTELYFVHSYTTAGTYTLTATSNTGAKAFVTFIVDNNYPDINISDYAGTLGISLNLPYTLNNVQIGSNEWVTSDNINAAFDKINTNFEYLNTATDSIRRRPDFSLTEWLRDLCEYPEWNNSLSGSDMYYTLSGSYGGVIPAESIVDIKAYKNNNGAPDYYYYVAYDNGLIQARKNNYNNVIVNQLTAVSLNSEKLNIYSVDTDGTDLYVLGSINLGGGSSPASVYRYYIGNLDNYIIPINQVGGSRGTLDDKNNFETSQLPNNIRLHKSNVYVGDVGNRCVKIYNTALTHINTVYSNSLSSYDVLQFNINPSNDNIYVLGRLYAPNPPVLTSVLKNDRQYYVTWNHDGERLNQSVGASANFRIYGSLNNSGTYNLIDQVSSVLPLTDPKLTTYTFESSAYYSSFKVEAIGIDGVITSEKSSSVVVPNKTVFASPYKLFVFDNSSNLLSSLSIPEIPPSIEVKKILFEPTGTFFYIVTTEYIYKYTYNGIFVNQMVSPSKQALGNVEDITSAFINEDYQFYLTTEKRVFKFLDVSTTEEIVNTTYNRQLYTPLSAIHIKQDEFVSDWVYNKSLQALLYNHEVLAKSINDKYVITLGENNQLKSFNTRKLYTPEYIDSLSANNDNFVYSNEIVSSAVVNRTLTKLYRAQQAILQLLSPEIIREVPSYTTNILGDITVSVPYMVSAYVPVVTTTTTLPPEPLPLLFSFASAMYVGNVYSDLYNGGTRYGNLYNATFNVLNATSSCNIVFDVTDRSGNDFSLPVEFTLRSENSIIFTTTIQEATAFNIAIQDVLTTRSDLIATDGLTGTYGKEFTVEISVGASTSTEIVKPVILVTTTNGYLYDAEFRSSVKETTHPDISLVVYNVSGATIPYAGITNNTLGGYLETNPYSFINWTINNELTGTNPSINAVSSTTFTLSAYRFTQGESDLVLGLSRNIIDPPEKPFYTLNTVVTQTVKVGAAGTGNGYIIGSGTYPAGTVVPVFAVASYGSFGRWDYRTNNFLLSGVGTSNTWISGPTSSGNYASNDAGGRVDGTIFIDGDKTIDVAFYHG